MKEADREKLMRKREKQKAKDDSKLEKQRRLKEEKLRKVADKEKERDKKKQQKLKQKSASASGMPAKIADFIQVGESSGSKRALICLFISLRRITCRYFWRNALGLLKAKVWIPREFIEFLVTERMWICCFKNLTKVVLHIKTHNYTFIFILDPNILIHELDIPVNAVATALKDFVSKRLPPLFEEDVMAELEDIAGGRAVIGTLRSCSFSIFSFRDSFEADGDNYG